MYAPKASRAQGPLYAEIGELVACSWADSGEWEERLVHVLGAGLGQGGYRASVVFGENVEGGVWDGGRGEKGIWVLGGRGGAEDGVCHHGGLGPREVGDRRQSSASV